MAVLINTPEDMQWLREVHDVEEEYNSAVVYGNEDAPHCRTVLQCGAGLRPAT